MHLVQLFWTGWFAHLKLGGILEDGYSSQVALYFKSEISFTKCKVLIFNPEKQNFCTQCKDILFVVVVEIFRNKLNPWVIN